MTRRSISETGDAPSLERRELVELPDASGSHDATQSQMKQSANTMGDAARSRALLGALRASAPGIGFVVLFAVMVAVFAAIKSGAFWHWSTAWIVLDTSDVSLLLAVGLVFILIVRDFDVSIAANLALAGSVGVMLMTKYNVPTVVAVLAAIVAGMIGGAVNGVIVAFFGANPLITTLGTTSVFVGVQEGITNNQAVTTGLQPGYLKIAAEKVGSVDAVVFVGLGLVLVGWVVLRKTVFGRRSYATGANSEASRLAGIRTKWIRFWAYVILGAFVGVAGVVYTAQSGGSPSAGSTETFLLPAYAAAFLGAITLGLGRFTAWSAAWGVVFVGVLETGLLVIGAPTWVGNLLTGLVLLGAVFISLVGKSDGDVLAVM